MSRLPTIERSLSLAGARPTRGLLAGLLEPFFGTIRVDAEDAERLVDAHARGAVVHVLRSHRVMDPLFIRYALHRLGLPPPVWLHDHYTSPLPDTADELARVVRQGGPSLLFLKRPRTLINPTTAYSERHVELLVSLQREIDTPILLLPETLLWTKRAVGLRRTLIDSIFGDRESPGRLREILGFFWHHADSRFHVGAAVDVRAVIEREHGQSDRVIAKKIRWAILHHLTREEQIRTGPMQRSAARTRHMVLNDPSVRRFLSAQAKGGGAGAIEKKADGILRTIAADMRYGWLRVVDAVIDLIWNRIYDGIVVDQEGLAKVRRAARRGPVVLVPSHKSHVDYLVLSQVFFKDGMMPPHIAAGDNLNFPPMGHIFRRSGAFFIRRSFKGDKLYAILFAAYVRRLLREGHAIEFFIEGGRSRTGKLLPPRMGMLSMCVDPVLDGKVGDVAFIPVSINYEKVIEAKSYAKELHGGKKQKEDVSALISSTRVLRSRYGRVYVDFGDPVSLAVFAAARGCPLRIEEPEESTPERRALITQLGHRIVNGLNAVTRVTPTSLAALVLLAQSRRGMSAEELHAKATRAIDFLDDLGARLSTTLAPETRRDALREAIGRFASEGLLQMLPAPDGGTIYRIEDEGRRALDYYKNNILHFFVTSAVVATAVLLPPPAPAARPGPAVIPEEEMLARVRRLSQILKLEFSFPVEHALEENFRLAANRLLGRKVLVRTEDGGTVQWSASSGGRSEVAELAGLLAVFFEAYRLTAETVSELREEPLSEKRFVARALLRARRQVLEGKMLRAEGASSVTFESALSLFVDQGIVRRGPGGLEIADEGARAALVEELDGYLRALAP